MSFETDVQKTITQILSHTPFSFDSISTDTSHSGELWCTIESKNPKEIIGKNGETLLALTHLVKRILEKTYRDTDHSHKHIILDVNNYQKNRIAELESEAHTLAEQARYFKSSVEARPMSSFERRIIHDFLSKESDIETESQGQGFERRIVIRWVDSRT